MALKTLTLLVAVGGIAAAFYRAGQRAALEQGRDDDDDAPLLLLDANGQPSSADTLSAATAGGTPNLGERLRDLKLANAGIGSSANAHNEDLLTPPRGEDQQSDVITPGLPDFARGA